jgi:hypothetical protein
MTRIVASNFCPTSMAEPYTAQARRARPLSGTVVGEAGDRAREAVLIANDVTAMAIECRGALRQIRNQRPLWASINYSG